MLGVRARSPGAGPAPWWGPGPAKRRRLVEPAAPEPPAPGPPDPAGPAAPAPAPAPASVLVLAAGSTVQVTVDGVDVLLEPEPASVLQVWLPGHTLVLIPEGLLGLAEGGGGGGGGVERGGCCAPSPEMARPEQVRVVEDADPEFPAAWVSAVPEPRARAPSSASPERDDLVHLLRPFPGSSLKPLPASPPPSPGARPQRPPRPWCKARRRLF